MPTGVYERGEELKKRLRENFLKIRQPKRKMKLTKEEVHHLYYEKKKTLAEIGKLGGVCRYRIGQLMEEWGYPRRKTGFGKGPRFKTLAEYLKHSEKTGTQTIAILRGLIKPHVKRCALCGATEKLHIKCLKWPVVSIDDFAILCPACLFTPHRKSIDGIEQREIRRRYEEGERVIVLAEEYGVTRGRIYHILHKR